MGTSRAVYELSREAPPANFEWSWPGCSQASKSPTFAAAGGSTRIQRLRYRTRCSSASEGN
jgi:hypothetical protein